VREVSFASFARAMRLGDNPLAFPLVPRHEHSGIRRRVFGNYLIFYLLEATTKPCCFPTSEPPLWSFSGAHCGTVISSST
jgi:hypothetical protein